MNRLLFGLIRLGARRLAANPKVRAASSGAVRSAAEQVRRIAREPDRPRAAGRAVRRLLNRFRDDP